MDFTWLMDFWPFGTSTLGLLLGGLIILMVVRFVAGLVFKLALIAAVVVGVGVYFFPSYMPISLPFGASPEPQWVLVSESGTADGIDVAYSVSVNPKASVNGLPVCDKASIGRVAVCGTPDMSVISGMVMSGLPSDLSVTGVPTGVCSYKKVASADYLYEGGASKVYECK